MSGGLGHVAVLGAGRSGQAAARALAARQPRSLVVVEERDSDTTRAAAEALRADGIAVVIGPDAATDLLRRDPRPDLVVTSPGVPQSHPLLAAGIPVWSEPELAVRLNAGRTRLVAVTGTNGKTSTTELLGACLDAPTAGNIGTPLVEVLASPSPPPLVVAELSSFQLKFTSRLRPEVAVLLNVAPDHLDWHGSLEDYGAAKARIWAAQHATDTVVSNADDAGARAVVAAHPPPGLHVTFTLEPPGPDQVGVADGHLVARSLPGAEPVALVAVDDLAARGPHNLANALAAAAAALAAGAEPASLAGPLSAFRPGPHRLEPVATVAGVAYVNDSKATNPHAAAAALSSFERVVWIAGGLGKGLDFRSLRDVIAARVRAAVTIGSAGPAIAAVARDAGVEVVEAGDLARAVPIAARLAAPGDTVLLAPACASMDQFRDYAERGQAFRDAVAALAPSASGRADDRGRRP